MYIVPVIPTILVTRHILLHPFHTFLFTYTIILITLLNIIHAIVKGTPEGLAGIRFVRRRISTPLLLPLIPLPSLLSSS